MNTTTPTPAGNVAKAEVITAGVIVTKYLGPTNSRGSRVKATSGSGKTATVSWDHELDAHDNHAAAATSLVWKALGIPADNLTLIGGTLPTNDGYAFAVLRK